MKSLTSPILALTLGFAFVGCVNINSGSKPKPPKATTAAVTEGLTVGQQLAGYYCSSPETNAVSGIETIKAYKVEDGDVEDDGVAILKEGEDGKILLEQVADGGANVAGASQLSDPEQVQNFIDAFSDKVVLEAFRINDDAQKTFMTIQVRAEIVEGEGEQLSNIPAISCSSLSIESLEIVEANDDGGDEGGDA